MKQIKPPDHKSSSSSSSPSSSSQALLVKPSSSSSSTPPTHSQGHVWIHGVDPPLSKYTNIGHCLDNNTSNNKSKTNKHGLHGVQAEQIIVVSSPTKFSRSGDIAKIIVLFFSFCWLKYEHECAPWR